MKSIEYQVRLEGSARQLLEIKKRFESLFEGEELPTSVIGAKDQLESIANDLLEISTDITEITSDLDDKIYEGN